MSHGMLTQIPAAAQPQTQTWTSVAAWAGTSPWPQVAQQGIHIRPLLSTPKSPVLPLCWLLFPISPLQEGLSSSTFLIWLKPKPLLPSGGTLVGTGQKGPALM